MRCQYRRIPSLTSKEDTLRVWDAFQANGKHLTGEEADAWLERLENGEDTDFPECHD